MTTAHTTTTDGTHAATPLATTLNSAEQSAQHLASGAVEHASQTLHTLMNDVSPALGRMADQVAALSRQGVHAVQATSHQVGDTVHHASDKTLGYIRNEPVKSVLMAVALGATLVTVFHLISRPHHAHQ
jgi:ElaB/YqjD/DUF883 family membrane-anchored ribosome-binding protein